MRQSNFANVLFWRTKFSGVTEKLLNLESANPFGTQLQSANPRCSELLSTCNPDTSQVVIRDASTCNPDTLHVVIRDASTCNPDTDDGFLWYKTAIPL